MAAGDILWRKGRPQEPGTFDPPITINPGHPSRDIVAVDTNQGRVLASVDATDNAISLYGWRDGSFVRIGSLPTGSLPAQIVTADLNGDGWDDLVVRNAGDGTLTVFFSNGSGSDATGNAPFQPSVTLPVGLGVSDVTLADVDRDGPRISSSPTRSPVRSASCATWATGPSPARAVPRRRRPVRRDEHPTARRPSRPWRRPRAWPPARSPGAALPTW